MGVPMQPRWQLLVPVKVRAAKTRLELAERDALAVAMTWDVLTAAQACDVVDVTTVPSSGGGLDADVLAAAAAWPDSPVAVLMADLPALRSAELRRALSLAAAHERAVVADAAGTGTVLLTARPGRVLAPSYGAGSRSRHVRLGAADLTDALADTVPGLRCDVDTATDLEAALLLGIGRETAAALDGNPAVRGRTPSGGKMAP